MLMVLRLLQLLVLLSSLLLPTKPMVLSCNRAGAIFENELEYCSMVNWNSARVYNVSTAREVYYDDSLQSLQYSDSSAGTTDNKLTSDALPKGKIQTASSILVCIEKKISLYILLIPLECCYLPNNASFRTDRNG